MNTIKTPTPIEWQERPDVIENLECDLAEAKFYLGQTQILIGAIDTLQGTESNYRDDADFDFNEAAQVIAECEEIEPDGTNLVTLRSVLIGIEVNQKLNIDLIQVDLNAAKVQAYDQTLAWIETQLVGSGTIRRLTTLNIVRKFLKRPDLDNQ